MCALAFAHRERLVDVGLAEPHHGFGRSGGAMVCAPGGGPQHVADPDFDGRFGVAGPALHLSGFARSEDRRVGTKWSSREPPSAEQTAPIVNTNYRHILANNHIVNYTHTPDPDT
ncbi:MAG: hypothetical protein AN485_24515, partial [Anabaena sp. MDT14b]